MKNRTPIHLPGGLPDWWHYDPDTGAIFCPECSNVECEFIDLIDIGDAIREGFLLDAPDTLSCHGAECNATAATLAARAEVTS